MEKTNSLDDRKQPRRESGYSPTLLGYSSAGCFPTMLCMVPEPASASPNEDQYMTLFKECKEETKERACRYVRLHRPFLLEEALACKASLR